MHTGFDFWLDGSTAEVTDEVRESMERANAAVVPTVRLTGVPSAYWCRIRTKEHLRWVMPYDEEPLLDALARLHARGEDGLGEGTRLIGTFRAHGLLVPVWDLVPGTEADELEDPAGAPRDRPRRSRRSDRAGASCEGRSLQPAGHSPLRGLHI